MYWAPPEPKTHDHLSRRHGKDSRTWKRRVDRDSAWYPPRALTQHARLSQYRASCLTGRNAGDSDEKQSLTPSKKGGKRMNRRQQRKKRSRKQKAFNFEAQTKLVKNLNPDHICMSLWHVLKYIQKQNTCVILINQKLRKNVHPDFLAVFWFA